MRDILAFSVTILSCISRFQGSLTCAGGLLSRKGVFCQNGKRDVDALVHSLLETDFSADSVLASAAKRVVRIVITVPAPPAPPKPSPPPPPTTTTTTDPPRRRRTVPSGYAVCEDTEPSDSLDSDCLSSRYASLTGSMYKTLSEISASKSLAETYVQKLEPIIPQILPPDIQTSLAAAINGALSDFQHGMEGGLEGAQKALDQGTKAASDMVSGVESSFTTSMNAMRSVLGPNFDSQLSLELGNLNKLISIANDLNLESTVPGVVQSVQFFVGNGTEDLLSHANFVNTEVNAISQLVDNLTQSIFYMTTNLTAQVIPILQSFTLNQTSARSNWIIGNGTQAINSIVALSNPAIANTLSKTVAGVDASIRDFNSSFGSMVAKSEAMGSATTANLAASVAAMKQDVAQSLSNLGMRILSVPRSMLSGVMAAIQHLIDASAENAQQLRGVFIPGIDAWNYQAQAEISKLQTKLANATSYLSRHTETAGGTSDAVMDRVLSSMATIGSLQQNITNALLERHSSGLENMRLMNNNMTSSGMTVAQLLTGINGAVQAMHLMPTTVNTPIQSTFAKIPSIMGNLADTVNRLSVRLNANLTKILESVDMSTHDFTRSIPLDWSSFTDSLEAAENSGTSSGLARISSDISNWVSSESQSAKRADIGMVSDKTVADGLANIYAGIADQVNQIDKRIESLQALFRTNLSSTAQKLVSSQSQINATTLAAVSSDTNGAIHSLISSASRAVDQWNTSAVARIKKMKIDQYSLITEAQGPEIQKASNLQAAYSNANASINSDLDDMRSGLMNALKGFKKTSEDVFNSLNLSKVSPLVAEVRKELHELMIDPKAISEMEALNSRVSIAESKIASANISLQSLHDSIQTVNRTLSSNKLSIVNLVKLMGEAENVKSVLNSETGVIDRAIASANTSEYGKLKNLTSTLDSDLTNFIDIPWIKSGLIDLVQQTARINTSFASEVAEYDESQQVRNALENNNFADIVNSISSGLESSASGFPGVGTIDLGALNSSVQSLGNAVDVRAASDERSARSLESVVQTILSAVSLSQNNLTQSLDTLLASVGGSPSQQQATDAALLVNDAIRNLTGSIASVSNVQSIVKAIHEAEVSNRENSISHVESSVEKASANLNSLIRGAITNTASLSTGLSPNLTLAQLIPIVNAQMSLLSQRNQAVLYSLNQTSDVAVAQESSILGNLENVIALSESGIRTVSSDIMGVVNSWNYTSGSDAVTSRHEALLRDSELQDVFSNYRADSHSFSPMYFSVNISSLATNSTDPTLRSVFDNVAASVNDVSAMLVLAGGN